MKIVEQTRIYNLDEWGAGGIFSAFSHDGQLIAVRVPNAIWKNGDKKDNIFVYDLNGNKKMVWIQPRRRHGQRGRHCFFTRINTVCWCQGRMIIMEIWTA